MIQSVCCIHQIKENARVDQWHYGLSKENPADYALQELDPRENLMAIGFMDHHSYGKWKHSGKTKTAA